MKSYRMGIVGEASYQGAIRECRIGQPVELIHEPENPYDKQAIRVDAGGATIGYIPRGSWLTHAMLRDGNTPSAVIEQITGGGTGEKLGVVLEVTLGGFVPAQPSSAAPPLPRRGSGLDAKGCFGILAFILVVGLVGQCDSEQAKPARQAAAPAPAQLVAAPEQSAKVPAAAEPAGPDASAERVERDAKALCAKKWEDNYALRAACVRNARDGAASWREIGRAQPGLRAALDRCVARHVDGGHVNWALVGGCARNQLDGWRELGN